MANASKNDLSSNALRATTVEENGQGEESTAAASASQEQHFRTDHLLNDLRGRAISGGLVTAGAQIGRFALNLASAVILARLLVPADFGLVAMVATLTGFLRIFKDAGLSTATVQKDKITQAQVSNLFWVNVSVSAFLSLIVAGLAPAVAWFYREPRLLRVTLALSIAFAVSGSVVQHQALLNRQMRYKALAMIDIAAAACGLLVGIAMAGLGCGYWSLVGMQLATTLAELVLTLSVSRWRPQRPMRRSGTRPMLNFGASLTLADFVRRLAAGTDTLLLGRFYGAEATGLYSRATVLLMRPLEQVIMPFEAVFMPVLSRLQDQPERYRRTFLQAYNAVALLSFPLAGLFLALSRPLVLVLLGANWEKVISIFAWFTIAAGYLPLYYASMSLLNTQGRGKDIMATSLNVLITTVISVAAGLPFGPAGVALAFACTGLLVRMPVQYYIAGRSGPVSTRDLWTVFLSYLPTWGAVFCATYLARRLVLHTSPFIQLCICTPPGLLAGAVVTVVIPWQRREALRLLGNMRDFLTQRK